MRQQGERKHGGRSTAASELLNFHFPTAPSTQRRQQTPTSPRNQRNRQPKLQHKQKEQQYRRTKEDRASARRKASAQNFPLHSSSDHAFVITRRAPSKPQQQLLQYSFNGPDAPVAWESVRMVKYLSSSSATRTEEERCPVCLDDLCCARITKCGHNFCLTCAIRCVHAYAAEHYSNTDRTTAAAKCPCCAIPMHLDDLRPLLLITTLPVAVHQHMKFIKLHRVKGCPAPFLPLPNNGKHSSPHAAPCQTDVDASYCRFNYVDPAVYQRHLTQNLQELQQQKQAQQQALDTNNSINHHCRRHAAAQEEDALVFLQMAIERVQRELHAAMAEADQEIALMERFQNPAAGFYQEHPYHLLASPAQGATLSNRDTRSTCSVDGKQRLQQQKQEEYADADDTDIKSVKHTKMTAWTTGEDEDALEADTESPPVSPNEATTPQSTTPTTDETKIRTTTNRYRGDSFASESSWADDSLAASSSLSEPLSSGRLSSSPRNLNLDMKSKIPVAASMFLDQDESAFYQAQDGSLCFLSGFNMKTLRTEFLSTVPDNAALLSHAAKTHQRQHQQLQQHSCHKIMPLPDVVEGRVVDVERTHLTPDLRSRLRFLSHLPIYSDVCFVEIGLGHLLSSETKKVFKKEFQKRKQSRQNRIKDEGKADARAKREEEARISELKARIQRIDPNDQFFRSVPLLPETMETGDDFGPALVSTSPSNQSAMSSQRPATTSTTSAFSFSQITREGGAFPALQTKSDFPSLASSRPPAPTPSPSASTATKWGPTKSVASDFDCSPATPAPHPPPAGRKKNKGKQILLFSTGSHRGSNY